MSFEQTIQQWINLDDEIKIYTNKLRALREKKNNLEKKATQMANDNRLLNSSIKINNANLKIVNTKITSPLTFKYLENSLGKIIQNNDQVQRILTFIKNNRETKIIQEIKRYYNN
jgi:CBS domain containing-hemolysin-like protein